jgi:tripartite-type tricarboxylate transporter receptor subunit TctC
MRFAYVRDKEEDKSGRETMRKLLAISMLVAAAISQPAHAADPWPTKPIRIIVPFAPGGTTDIMGRLIANTLGKNVPQPVVVENRAGAGGIVGTDAMVRSPADGYTVALVISSHATNAVLQPNAPYDPIKDVTPITLIGFAPNVLVVPLSSPVSTLQEFIAHAKANPGTIHYGSPAYGGSQHIGGETLKLATGITMEHVLYRGSSQIFPDLLAGRLQAFFANIVSGYPYIDGARVKALGTSSIKRSPRLPNVPTVAEGGVADFNVVDWYGILAPPKLPPELTKKLTEEFARAINAPETADKLRESGVDVTTNTSEEFGKFMVEEIAKFKDLAQKVNLKAE